jgi:hypothetical protein
MSRSTGASIMYDKDPISSQQTGAMSCVSTAALLIDDEAPEPALVSFNRLRSVVAELFAAVNETLRDDRTNAAACLQRAQAMLHCVEGPLLQTSAGVRGGSHRGKFAECLHISKRTWARP